MMPTQTQPAATGNRARVARYRRLHRRFDYSPAGDVLKIIEAWLAQGLSNCHAGVIDSLILAGHQAMSGNASGDHAPGGSERSAHAHEAPTNRAALKSFDSDAQ